MKVKHISYEKRQYYRNEILLFENKSVKKKKTRTLRMFGIIIFRKLYSLQTKKII